MFELYHITNGHGKTKFYNHGTYAFSTVKFKDFQGTFQAFPAPYSCGKLHIYIQYMYVKHAIYFASLSHWIRCYSGFLHLFPNSNSSILSIFKVYFQAPFRFGKLYIFILYIHSYLVHTHILQYSMTYFMSLCKRRTLQSDRNLLWK